MFFICYITFSLWMWTWRKTVEILYWWMSWYLFTVIAPWLILIFLYRDMDYDGVVLESWSRWAAYGVLHDPSLRKLVYELWTFYYLHCLISLFIYFGEILHNNPQLLIFFFMVTFFFFQNHMVTLSFVQTHYMTLFCEKCKIVVER